MKVLLISTALVAGFAATAQAQGLSFGVDGSVGLWSNSDGGAGLSSNGGIDGTDTRTTGRLELSVANDFGFAIGQVDLKWQGLSAADPSLDDDDSTKWMADVTLRAMRDFGGVRAGLFYGEGNHNDGGDSDELMGYNFYGVDVSAPMAFGELFGQIGRFDSFDQYDEGTQEARFIRLGASGQVGGGYTLTGALSASDGKKYASDENRILAAELGISRALEGTPYTFYANYDYTRIYYEDGGKYGDNFSTLWVGVKMDFGGPTKRGGKLPNFGQWVAYNANEIE